MRNQIDVQPAAGPCTKHVDGQQWRASTRPRGALAGVKNRLCLSASESRAHQTLSRVRIKVFMLDIHRRSPLRRQEEGLLVDISYLPHDLLSKKTISFFSVAKSQGEERER